MATILIFKELERLALDEDEKDVVLFGKRDWLDDGNRVYGFIFHAEAGVKDVYRIKWPVSLVVPVLRNIPRKNVPPALAQLNKENPDFARFAVARNLLTFYEVRGEGIGLEVINLGSYKKTPTKRFFDHVQDVKLEKEIAEIIEEIRAAYH
jgi:hypothetical protein